MSHSRVVLNETRFADNLTRIRKELAEAAHLMLVVKADAYGHGLGNVVACASAQGCSISV